MAEYNTNAALTDATTTAEPVILNPANGQYYQGIGTALGWTDAKALAESRQLNGVQGRLAQINDAAENGFAARVGSTLGSDVWIGLSDNERFGGTESIGQPNPQIDGWVWSGPADTTGTFESRSLASTGYTNWNSGEPNGTGEDAAEVLQGSGRWNDLSTGNTQASLIQYETSPLPLNFVARAVNDASGGTGTLSTAQALLNFRRAADGEVTRSYAALNFTDPQGVSAGSFAGDVPFPNDTAGNDDNFAVRARGSIVIPAAGTYTYHTNSDDGFEVVFETGPNAPVVNSTGIGNLLTQVTYPAAGTYNVTITFGEGGGGAGFELAAAPGAKGSLDGDFRVVGDTLNGGLATDGLRDLIVPLPYTVRDVHSTGTVGNLADADALLDSGSPGIASETTSSTLRVDYFDTGGNGNFGLDLPFPDGGGDDFAVDVTADLIVSQGAAGWWTFLVNSDDGFRLTIEDDTSTVVPFASASGASINGGSLEFPAPRGASDSFGSILLSPGRYDLLLRYFERGGGDEVELAYAPGTLTSFNGSFRLLTAAPEPTTLTLLALGGLGLWRKRRRRS